jgi:hypothetical protein
MNIYIFWDTMLYSLVKVSRLFGEAYRLHPQGGRVSQARNQHEAGNKDAEDGDMLLVHKPTERRTSKETRMTKLRASLLPLFVANA